MALDSVSLNNGDAMTPATFAIKIVQQAATPAPVTTALGTGSSATRTDFFIVLPSQVGFAIAQPSAVVVPQPPAALEAAARFPAE